MSRFLPFAQRQVGRDALRWLMLYLRRDVANPWGEWYGRRAVTEGMPWHGIGCFALHGMAWHGIAPLCRWLEAYGPLLLFLLRDAYGHLGGGEVDDGLAGLEEIVS